MRRPRRSRRRRFVMPEVSLTPLIDTALTLLIIFIVTAPAIQNGIKVDLPFGKSKEVGQQQEFVVSINKKEDVFFNTFPVAKSNLAETVKNALIGKEDMPVYVRGDQAISYGKVIEIVDSLKQAGVKFVAMSTSPNAKS